MAEESVGDLFTPPAATGPRSASTEFPGTSRNKASSPVTLSEDSATPVIHQGAVRSQACRWLFLLAARWQALRSTFWGEAHCGGGVGNAGVAFGCPALRNQGSSLE